jgi:hypothetical protein
MCQISDGVFAPGLSRPSVYQSLKMWFRGWQTRYADGVITSHGITTTNPSQQVLLTFLPGEFISSMWGSAGWGLNNILFLTSQGRVLGPYGSYNDFGQWKYTGPVYGFFGSTCNHGCEAQQGCLNGLGAWTIPSIVPQIDRNLIPSSAWLAPYYKDPTTTWDDGPHPGKFHIAWTPRNTFFRGAVLHPRVFPSRLPVVTLL